MKFCPKCGKQLPDEARFCGGCGTKISVSKPDAKAKKQPEKTFTETQRKVSSGGKKGKNDNRAPKKKSRNRRIAAGILLVVGICVAGLVLLFGMNSSSETETSLLSGGGSIGTSETETLLEELSEVSVGDSVTFGTYEQDGDLENGQEAIEWIVLDEQDDCILLISDKILDQVSYVEESVNFTWEGSYLRSWCNDDFYNTAFTEAEQGLICTTTVCTLRESDWNSVNGKNTEDKVFILSSDEICSYLTPYQERQCGITAYANKSGTSGVHSFWLRCNSISLAARYMKNGLSLDDGEAMSEGGDSDLVGVRPCIWVSTTGTLSDDIVMGDDAQARLTQVGDTLYIGDTGTYGSLEWIVLAIEDDMLLLITKDVLSEDLEFDDNGGVSWDTCTLRTWLNSEFFENYSIDEETQSVIMTTTIVTEGCSDTQDQVFLLSEDEVEKYFYTTDEREATEINGGKAVQWMLRSTESGRVQFVLTNGSITDYKTGSNPRVRPAMWVQDESLLTYYVADADRNIVEVGDPDTVSPVKEAGGESDENEDGENSNSVAYLMTDNILKSNSTGTVLGSDYSRLDICSITFLDNFDDMPSNAWDVSKAGDKSIMAWVVYNDDVDKTADYYLYIASESIIVPSSGNNLFAWYTNVTSIDFNGIFSTEGVTSLSKMFYRDSSLEYVDVSSFDTSSVTYMVSLFEYCNSLTELDLSGWDTSQVTNMSRMFYCCTSLTSIGCDLEIPDGADTEWMYANSLLEDEE